MEESRGTRDKFMNWPRRWDKWLKLGRMASLFIGEHVSTDEMKSKCFFPPYFVSVSLKTFNEIKGYVARPAISV